MRSLPATPPPPTSLSCLASCQKHGTPAAQSHAWQHAVSRQLTYQAKKAHQHSQNLLPLSLRSFACSTKSAISSPGGKIEVLQLLNRIEVPLDFRVSPLPPHHCPISTPLRCPDVVHTCVHTGIIAQSFTTSCQCPLVVISKLTQYTVL